MKCIKALSTFELRVWVSVLGEQRNRELKRKQWPEKCVLNCLKNSFFFYYLSHRVTTLPLQKKKEKKKEKPHQKTTQKAWHIKTKFYLATEWCTVHWIVFQMNKWTKIHFSFSFKAWECNLWWYLTLKKYHWINRISWVNDIHIMNKDCKAILILLEWSSASVTSLKKFPIY